MKIFKISLFIFVLYWLHGALLGMTDDEAYYWVLSKKSALGYAFHPPAVAWSIQLSEILLGWIPGLSATAIARFPSAFFTAVVVALFLVWLREVGVPLGRLKKSFLCLFSFVGVFAAAWMVVPDLPLFTGWMMVYLGTWRFCKKKPLRQPFGHSLGLLFFGMVLTMLSKFSGVLVGFSAVLCISFTWFFQDRRLWWKGVAWIAGGTLLGTVPTLIWNAQNEWGAVAYQLSGRHSGDLNWLRYMRFWVTQLAGVGIPVILFGAFLPLRLKKFKGVKRQVAIQTLLFAAPAAMVFLIQPLFSDFKPHWAIVVWFPIFLELVYLFAQDQAVGFARAQMAYGVPLVVVFLLSCHFPIISVAIEAFTGKANPLWDVTNDMYGWKELPKYVERVAGKEALKLPVVGSRYQTASQAAFVWPDRNQVVRIPRSKKERDEWPQIDATDGYGPHWPALKSEVLFVGDIRYHQGPDFKNAKCVSLGRLSVSRWRYLAKWIEVWQCWPKDHVPKKRK